MSSGRDPAEIAGAGVPADRPRRTAYLAPGQLVASAEPADVSTILGSCVAVCLWDARSRIGGANHFLLPDWAGSEGGSARYGNVATEGLVRRLERLGASRRGLRAKLFGGAAILAAFRDRDDHLGARNVEVARRLLADLSIPIMAEDVGGNRGRKLIFRTDDGLALVRLIQEGP